MIILLFYDIIIEYLSQKTSYCKNQRSLNRDNLINRGDNKLIFSNHYIDFIDDYLSNNDTDILDLYQTMICKLSDENRIYNISSGNTKNILDEFIYLHNACNDNIFFTFSEEPINNNLINYNYCVTSNSLKPNKNWLLLELCANHIANLHFHYFNSDSQINDFFRDFFSLPRNLSVVNILDDYHNYRSHNNFNFIRSNIKVNYYSTKLNPSKFPRGNYTPNELSALKSSIQSWFHSSSSFYVTTDRALTHPRRVLFENLVLYSDIDFNQIKAANKNWNITIEYSINNYAEIINNLNNFTIV